MQRTVAGGHTGAPRGCLRDVPVRNNKRVNRSSLGVGAAGAVGPPHPYARVTELVQALQRGYLELEGVGTEAAEAARRRRVIRR